MARAAPNVDKSLIWLLSRLKKKTKLVSSAEKTTIETKSTPHSSIVNEVFAARAALRTDTSRIWLF